MIEGVAGKIASGVAVRAGEEPTDAASASQRPAEFGAASVTDRGIVAAVAFLDDAISIVDVRVMGQS